MQPLVYVDTSEVREGALGQLREAIAALAGFVEEHEPELISYSVYFSEDGRRMTVVHVHADRASLDHHMEVAGPRFAAFADLVRLSSIHIFGDPSEKAVGQLRDKVRLLGTGDVVVHRPHAGFARFGVSDSRTPALG
jgi:quinol monooxygenase YgiN